MSVSSVSTSGRLHFLLLFSLFVHLMQWSMGSGGGSELSKLTQELLESAREAKFSDWLTRVRRRIHETPLELAFEEHEASAVIRSELDILGIKYTWPVAETVLVASIGSGVHPFFALRADLDGLHIQECKSRNPGRVLACGHDVHVTMLLGAAKLLQQRSKELKGTVKLVFQLGEEDHAGAYHMLKAGGLDKVQAIFGLHVTSELPTGTIGLRPGPVVAGSARFLATIRGKGGHAAQPHATRDPVIAASSAIISLQLIVSQEMDPLETRVISVGFVEGGHAGNVIPETVRFGGTLQSMTSEGLSFLMQRVKEVIEMQPAVHRCSGIVEFMEDKSKPYPATVNDEVLYIHVKKVGESLLGEANVHLLPMSMDVEEFRLYSQKIPAALLMIGTSNETLKSGGQIHSPYLVIGEDVLPIGAALHAAVAISYLDSHLAEIL